MDRWLYGSGCLPHAKQFEMEPHPESIGPGLEFAVNLSLGVAGYPGDVVTTSRNIDSISPGEDVIACQRFEGGFAVPRFSLVELSRTERDGATKLTVSEENIRPPGRRRPRRGAGRWR